MGKCLYVSDLDGTLLRSDETISEYTCNVIYPDYTLMRKRVKKNFARRLKKVKSRKRRVEIVGSLWGMAKHANCWHLLEK